MPGSPRAGGRGRGCAGTEESAAKGQLSLGPRPDGEVQLANKQDKDGEPERDGTQVEELPHAEVRRYEIWENVREYTLSELAGAQDGLWGMAGNGALKDGTESNYDERPCLIKLWINLYVMKLLNFSQPKETQGHEEGPTFPKNTMWMGCRAAVLSSLARLRTSKKADSLLRVYPTFSSVLGTHRI